MQLRINRIFLTASILIALAINADAARADSPDLEFRQGLSAFNSGDYVEALRLWRGLAERGDPRSETGLGFMYHRGMGVPVDDGKAFFWLTKAAEHGQPEGQLLLGSLYFYGQGVAQSYVHAFAWCDLAEQGGQSDAFQCREASSQGLISAEEQAEAQRLSTELRDRLARKR